MEQSQAWLARRVGVSPATMSRWLNLQLPDLPERDRGQRLTTIAATLMLDPTQSRQLYASLDLVVDADASRTPRATAPADVAIVTEYLRTIRDHCGWAKTHVYHILATSDRTPNLPLLDQAGQKGVYVPLRYDLQAARELDGEIFRAERIGRKGKRRQARDALFLNEVQVPAADRGGVGAGRARASCLALSVGRRLAPRTL